LKNNLEKNMDIEEYKSLITNYPLFNLLSQENIEKLALLGKEVFLDKGLSDPNSSTIFTRN